MMHTGRLWFWKSFIKASRVFFVLRGYLQGSIFEITSSSIFNNIYFKSIVVEVDIKVIISFKNLARDDQNGIPIGNRNIGLEKLFALYF